jgi:hypothetical protein
VAGVLGSMRAAQGDITADAVEAFLAKVLAGQPENQGVMAAESTLTSLLGRPAADLGREVTCEELLASA